MCQGIDAALTFEKNSIPNHCVAKPKDPSKNINDINPTPSIKKNEHPTFQGQINSCHSNVM